jgi:hypothetical protein
LKWDKTAYWLLDKNLCGSQWKRHLEMVYVITKPAFIWQNFQLFLSVGGYESHQKDIGKFWLGFFLNFSICFSVDPTKALLCEGGEERK